MPGISAVSPPIRARQLSQALPKGASRQAPALIGIQFACCKVVKKKQGFRTLYHQIVDTHGNKINPHRVMPACFNSDCLVPKPSLAVTRTGSLKPAAFKVEQAAEAAKFGIGAGPCRCPHRCLDFI